jgi:hypothetical protein
MLRTGRYTLALELCAIRATRSVELDNTGDSQPRLTVEARIVRAAEAIDRRISWMRHDKRAPIPLGPCWAAAPWAIVFAQAANLPSRYRPPNERGAQPGGLNSSRGQITGVWGNVRRGGVMIAVCGIIRRLSRRPTS